MAITIMPKSNTTVVQDPTFDNAWRFSMITGAYAWGDNVFDFDIPTLPALGTPIMDSALRLSIISALSAFSVLPYA